MSPRLCLLSLVTATSRALAGAALIACVVGPSEAHAQTSQCGNGTVEADEQCDDGNLSENDCCSNLCRAQSPDGPCDDGRKCTVQDACRRGACVGIPTDGLCALGTASLACYAANPAPNAVESFEPRKGETMADEFSSEAASVPLIDLVKPGLLCIPASLDGAAAPVDASWEVYRARSDRATRPFRTQVVEIENTLGRAELTIGRVREVLTGSGVAIGADDAPPAKSDRRYSCYRVASKGEAPKHSVSVADDRGGSRDVLVTRPRTLCVPEIESPQQAHGGYLACYRASQANDRLPVQFAATANRFGSESLRLGGLRDICLPTALVPQPEPGPALPFLLHAGAVPAALKTLVDLVKRAPRTPEAVRADIDARDAALAVLEADIGAARAEVLTALRASSRDDKIALLQMTKVLEVVGDAPEILDHLEGLLFEPERNEDFHQRTPADAVVRQLALAQLLYHAERGSEEARERLLDSVASPHLEVQAIAVARLYAMSRNRREIRQAMRALMAPESQYLLYVQ